MAQHLLNGAQVRPIFQQVGGKEWRRVWGVMSFSIPAFSW